MASSPQVKCKPYFKLRSHPSASLQIGGLSGTAAAPAPGTVPILCAAYNWPTGPDRRRHHRHRRARRRLGAVRHGRRSSNPSTSPYRRSPTSPSTAPRTAPTRASAPPTIPITKSRSTSRSPAPLTMPPPARPPPSASTGRRTSPRPSRRPRRMAATYVPSPGARTKPTGAPRRQKRWNPPQPRPPPPAWSSSRPRATTTPATAAPHPPMSMLPSSCPHVVGCGGTYKTSTEETVWNDNPGQTNGEGTGGGYSTIFPGAELSDWRSHAAGTHGGKGRMVPDVTADADPNTGYDVFVHGSGTVVGGTSAVAPLYAGLFASFGTKLGFVTPSLYQNPTAFNDITSGRQRLLQRRSRPRPVHRPRFAHRVAHCRLVPARRLRPACPKQRLAEYLPCLGHNGFCCKIWACRPISRTSQTPAAEEYRQQQRFLAELEDIFI